MKPAYVLNEEERKIRHQKRTSGTLKTTLDTPTVTIPKSPKDDMTTDEMMVLFQGRMQFKSYISQKMTDFYESNPNLFKIMVRGMYFKTNIPFEAWNVFSQAFNGFLCTFLLNKPEFDGISDTDKKTIVENNSQLICNVGASVVLGNQFVSERHLSTFRRIFNQDSTNPLKRVLQELNINTWPRSNIQYKQVFTSPWAPHLDLEKRDEKLTQKISKWPWDNEEFDGLMMGYLMNILLFNTDFLALENPQSVALVQTKYVKMLHRYLKSKYGQTQANTRFGSGIMIASLARESNEIRRKRLPF